MGGLVLGGVRAWGHWGTMWGGLFGGAWCVWEVGLVCGFGFGVLRGGAVCGFCLSVILIFLPGSRNGVDNPGPCEPAVGTHIRCAAGNFGLV